MRFNEKIEHEIVTDLTAEPVSVDDLKRELNMLFDTDGSYEFGDDDTLLASKIKTARIALEEYTNLSFGAKTIRAILRNELGDVELPYAPIVEISSVKNSDGDEINDYKTIGLRFKRICYPTYSYLDVTYTAGYEELPEALKAAILAQAAYLYAHRGEELEDKGICKAALELATPFKRSGWIA